MAITEYSSPTNQKNPEMDHQEQQPSQAPPPTTPAAAAAVNAASNAPASSSKSVIQRFSLDGKTAVVTGGARGLGFEMARALCESGVTGIAIVDILDDAGQEAIKELNTDFGVTSSFYRVDVRNDLAVKEVFDAIVRDFGGIDVLIASAGVADLVKAEEYPPDRFRRVIDINLNGVFYCAQVCGQHMIKRAQGGSIIMIASMSGHIVNHPQPQCAYNASKAAVIHLSKSLAAEWAPHGIRCNTISPGYMNTKLNANFDAGLKKEWNARTPMGRMGGDAELNAAAVFLASEASSFVTGSDMLIDGGYTVW